MAARSLQWLLSPAVGRPSPRREVAMSQASSCYAAPAAVFTPLFPHQASSASAMSTPKHSPEPYLSMNPPRS